MLAFYGTWMYVIVRFKVLTTIVILFFNFWVLVPCWYVGRCRRFGETYCLHLAGLKWQVREIEGLYMTRKVRADRREPSPLFPYLFTSVLEDGDSTFLRNVGIDQHINTAPKTKNYKKTRILSCPQERASGQYLSIFYEFHVNMRRAAERWCAQFSHINRVLPEIYLQ
jgi:hypothetical protein